MLDMTNALMRKLHNRSWRGNYSIIPRKAYKKSRFKKAVTRACCRSWLGVNTSPNKRIIVN